MNVKNTWQQILVKRCVWLKAIWVMMLLFYQTGKF